MWLVQFWFSCGAPTPTCPSNQAGLATVEAAEVSHLVKRVIYNYGTIQEDHSVAKQHIQAGRDISVGGDFVAADAINGSFNKVAALRLCRPTSRKREAAVGGALPTGNRSPDHERSCRLAEFL